MEENIDVTVRSSDIDIYLGMDMEIKCTTNACFVFNKLPPEKEEIVGILKKVEKWEVW